MVSPAVREFMKRSFTHCRVNEAYGITECGSITFSHTIEKTVEYRLGPVPDLGYTVDDQPYPRGELLAKTTQMFSGYINDPQQSAAALTHDGFFRTGDIVELRSSSTYTEPHLDVIDRTKNFFKLAQGQFIAPEYLQSLFIQSSFVD
jgi:fatty acid CoA ligase FadD9